MFDADWVSDTSKRDPASKERPHNTRFTGKRLEALVEGLRLVGWDGKRDGSGA
jgi:hypothetical protein